MYEVATEILTVYCRLYLSKLGLVSKRLYRFFALDLETEKHLLRACPALALNGSLLWGKHLLEVNDQSMQNYGYPMNKLHWIGSSS